MGIESKNLSLQRNLLQVAIVDLTMTPSLRVGHFFFFLGTDIP